MFVTGLQTLEKNEDPLNSDHHNQTGKRFECGKVGIGTESQSGNKINLLTLSSSHTIVWTHSYFNIPIHVYITGDYVWLCVRKFYRVLNSLLGSESEEDPRVQK